MTDEQWLWLFINQAVDADEELEGMCDDCRHEVTSTNRCSRCGKTLAPKGDYVGNDIETGVSSSFDIDKYEAMKNGRYESKKEQVTDETEHEDSNVDVDLIKQILDQGDDNG